MIHAQNSKRVSLITPGSVATNAAATGTVSLAGWDYAEVVLHLATQTASNVWYLDCRKRKKNLKITYEAVGAARIASAHVVLSRGEASPTTAAGRGITGQVVA